MTTVSGREKPTSITNSTGIAITHTAARRETHALAQANDIAGSRPLPAHSNCAPILKNVELLGPPGVDQTRLTSGLAIRTAQRARRVYHGPLVDLIRALEEAHAAGQLTRRLAVLTHPSLLVVVVIGYITIPHPRHGAFLAAHAPPVRDRSYDTPLEQGLRGMR